MFFGGVAIALLRLIAVRYTHLMARWGEFKIMFTILFLWQAVLITNTYLMFISNAGKKTYRRRTDVFKISFKIDPLNRNFGRFY